jgi:hypothetical protein
MKDRLSPYEIKILIHFYICNESHVDADTDSYLTICKEFRELGVIEVDPKRQSSYTVTGLGIAWLMSMLSTPIPKLAYVDRCGNIIEV